MDTRVKLLELIAGAKESVFWAGYRFDDKKLMEPLCEVLCTRAVDVTMVLEVKSDKDDGSGREKRIEAAVDDFFETVWEWKDIRPRLYVDPRSAGWNADPEHPKRGYF